MTPKNASAGALFEFLNQLAEVIRGVLQIKDPLTPNPIKLKPVDIVELLDEMVNRGYPQNTDPESLRLPTQRQSASSAIWTTESRMTIMVTGAISCRSPDIRYRRNEIFVDVIQPVSVLVSVAGKTFDCSINGPVMMGVRLSGMPKCKIGFNDTVTVESDGIGGGARGPQRGDDRGQ
jgi:AP-2 complex subunit mu-1